MREEVEEEEEERLVSWTFELEVGMTLSGLASKKGHDKVYW